MQMVSSDWTCNEFVRRLGSRESVPGGGGASALAGALGAALGNMVGALTVGKKKYAAVEPRMYDMMARCEVLQHQLLALVERDAQVFAPLAQAYGMKSDTAQEKAEKERVMESALRGACTVPMQIMEACCEAVDLLRVFADEGSSLAVSDAGAGAAICRGALQAASLNIYINTGSMKDRHCAEELNRKADEMLEKYVPKAEEIFNDVMRRLKETLM